MRKILPTLVSRIRNKGYGKGVATGIKKLGKKVTAILLVLIILSGIAAIYWTRSAKAVWYNNGTDYGYRQSITITNNGSTKTTHVVEVVVDTKTLIDAGKMQSDCDDVRFAGTDKITPLDYFTEYCSNTTVAGGGSNAKSVFFVEVPTITGSTTTTIYMYYGYPSATSGSSYSAIANYPVGVQLGTGKDGPITISSDTNINTADTISGRTCTDAGISYDGDSPIYTSTDNVAAGDTTIDLATSPDSSCLAVGDEVLVFNARGTDSATGDGKYEFARITTISTNVITLNRALTNAYNGTTRKLVIQRVPNYTTVTLSNSGTDFVPSAWDGTTNFSGGVMAFRATGAVTIASGTTINADGLGYVGGSAGTATETGGNTGESYDGAASGRGGNGASAGESRGGGEAGDGSTASPNNGVTTGAGGGGGSDGSVNHTSGTGGGGGGGGGAGYGAGGGGGGGNTDFRQDTNTGTGGTGGSGGTSAGTAAGGGGAGCNDTSGGASTGNNGGNAGSAGSNGTTACGNNGVGGGEVGNTSTPNSTQGSGGGGAGSTGGAGAGGGGGGYYGSASLTTLYFGSGGGGGGAGDDGGDGGNGGTGGGIVFISASEVSMSGTISANGSQGSAAQAGGGGGGGGAGGSVLIKAISDTGTWTNVNASGGAVRSAGTRIAGGAGGGVGRTHVDYTDTSAPAPSSPTADLSQLPAVAAPTGETTYAESLGVEASTWKFDEGYGTTTNDSTGNRNTGTLAGTTLPTWQNNESCLSDKCLYFNGVTSKVTAALAVNAKSISLWVRPATSSAALITLATGIDIRANAGTVETSGITSPTIYVNGKQTTTGFTANQWNHVEVTTNTSISASGIVLGQSLLGNLNGFLDDVRLYSTVQTADQVKSDFVARGSNENSSRLGPDMSWISNGLVGYWKMDESSWNTTCTTTYSILDSSGLRNNGRSLVRQQQVLVEEHVVDSDMEACLMVQMIWWKFPMTIHSMFRRVKV